MTYTAPIATVLERYGNPAEFTLTNIQFKVFLGFNLEELAYGDKSVYATERQVFSFQFGKPEYDLFQDPLNGNEFKVNSHSVDYYFNVINSPEISMQGWFRLNANFIRLEDV